MNISNLIDEETKKLLSTPINQLHLSIPGSPLEQPIRQLYSELTQKNISFSPRCYLSDEWGCPYDTPLIGIPFYLADEKLSEYEGRFSDTQAENEKEIMMYLRHEAGHAINYAYTLFNQPLWEKMFGSFHTPYKERYKWIPNHSAFVIHLPDWYAQKHPDEDFAETFAIWLTPDSNWKVKYKDTPAFMKLEYVENIMSTIAGSTPLITSGTPDVPVEEITQTLKEWYISQGGKVDAY